MGYQAYGLGFVVFVFIVGWFLFNTLKILKQYERGVIFTLGRVSEVGGVKGPGIIILIPGIQKMVRVGLRTVTMDVPAWNADAFGSVLLYSFCSRAADFEAYGFWSSRGSRIHCGKAHWKDRTL